MKEISVAADAFVRNAPLPTWADLLPLPAPVATRRAVTIRLDDTHLLVADKPVQLVNAAQQVNDASVLGQIGQIAVQFIPQYQRLLLHKVALLRGDQLIDQTASVPVRFLQREAGLESGIYSGVITASLLLPDVRVGDTLLLQYSIEGANPILGQRYVQAAPWQRPVPVQVRRVTLNVPAGREIQWKWIGDGVAPPTQLQPVTSTADGMQRLRFEEHDMPAVELEPMMPRGTSPLRWLQFSEFASWGDVARWADALFPADEPLPNELLPLVQRWLALPSRSEQASHALQWVQSNIRYVSVSLGESSHRPHSPAEVLRNRYGDCKDKSFLLMRILQSLGIPAHAVLASLGAPQGPARQLASPLAFDHAVVAARIDGRDVFLDPTRLGQRGPVERMGQGQEEASVLVVDRDTTGLVVVRSPNRRELFHGELSESFRLNAFDEDGLLDARQQWNGLQAELIRLTLARTDPASLQRNLLAALTRRYPAATPIGSPELTDEVDLNRITLHASYKIPKLATATEGNWAMRYLPSNLQGSFAVPPSATRSFPLGLPAFPGNASYSVEMQWPESVSAVVDPVTQRIANDQFVAEITRSFRGNTSRMSVSLEALTPSVPAKNVPALLDDVKALERGIGGGMVVARNQIKAGGFLGIGRKTLQDNLAARAQATIERTGKAIGGGQLSGDDLAQALCVRSQAQSELGHAAEALKDADEAVRVAPSFEGAWFCRANARWAAGDFSNAETDATRSLVLGHTASEAYYRRGQARYYAGKFEAAADDFAKSAADRRESGEKAYALMWQAWALQRLGQPLPPGLTAFAAEDPRGAWPRPALAMVAGLLTPEQVLAEIERKDGDERELALAEGWFYIGEVRLLQAGSDPAQRAKAREAFESSRAKGITLYVEHTAAGFELERLGARP